MVVRDFGPPIARIYNTHQDEFSFSFLGSTLSKPEQKIWQAFLPQRLNVCELHRYRGPAIPEDVLIEIERLRLMGLFDSVEIWMPRGSINDPLLVVRVGDMVFVRKQWGEALISFKRACYAMHVSAFRTLQWTPIALAVARIAAVSCIASLCFARLGIGFLIVSTVAALIALAAAFWEGELRSELPSARRVLAALADMS